MGLWSLTFARFQRVLSNTDVHAAVFRSDSVHYHLRAFLEKPLYAVNQLVPGNGVWFRIGVHLAVNLNFLVRSWLDHFVWQRHDRCIKHVQLQFAFAMLLGSIWNVIVHNAKVRTGVRNVDIVDCVVVSRSDEFAIAIPADAFRCRIGVRMTIQSSVGASENAQWAVRSGGHSWSVCK